MPDEIRWGILGTGAIAKKFAAGLRSAAGAKLYAIGSRSLATANAFSREFNVSRSYGNYEALVADPDVDAVYIASPHSCHQDNAILSLNAGKPVLCEKPFTMNASQGEEVIRLARQRKILLMEAMWTRFFPLMGKFRELLAEESIGELQILTADFGFRADFAADSRLFAPKYGGGALLDVGVYPVSLASMIFGVPAEVQGTAVLGQTGVDEQTGMILKYPNGPMAVLHTSIRANTACEVELIGSRGRIKIHSPWWKPSALTLMRDGKTDQRFEMPYPGNGYQFEAIVFMNCLRQHKLECDLMTLDETLSILKTLDALRGQFGLRYPME